MLDTPYKNYSEQSAKAEVENSIVSRIKMRRLIKKNRNIFSAGSILKNSIMQIISNLRKVLICWFIHLVSSAIVCIVILMLILLIFQNSFSYPSRYAKESFFLIIVSIFIGFIISCFVFGFLSYLSNIFLYRNENSRIIFSGFRRFTSIFIFAMIILIPIAFLISLVSLTKYDSFRITRFFYRLFRGKLHSDVNLLSYLALLISLAYLTKFTFIPLFLIQKDKNLVS